MPQHSFRNAIKLLKAKQHKWKRSLCKKFAWLKTKSNSHDLDTTTIIPKPESYAIAAIRATRRFPIDDFSDSDSDSEEEEDLAAESSSPPDGGSNSSNESTSSSEVYDVPPSCQTQNSACSASTSTSTSTSTTTSTSASAVYVSSTSVPETSPETDDSNVPERPEPEVLNTFSGRFSSFRKSTCTASTRDSYVTAASYLDSDEDEDEGKDEDEDKAGDKHEDEYDSGPGSDGDESIRSDTSNTSFFESESRDSQSDTSTSSTLASSISC